MASISMDDIIRRKQEIDAALSDKGIGAVGADVLTSVTILVMAQALEDRGYSLETRIIPMPKGKMTIH